MIVCEIELFYKRAVGALFSRSCCQNFYTTEASGGGNPVGCWGSLEGGILKGRQGSWVSQLLEDIFIAAEVRLSFLHLHNI